MVALAITALAKVGAAFGLAGAAGATTATTAATAATTAGSGVLGALQGFASAVSILGQIGAGASAAQQSRNMATEATLQAGQEQVAGAQRQTQMKRELAQVLGKNNVTFAAAGIDLSAGLAQDTAADAKNRAMQEISIDQQDTEFKQAMLRLRAQGYRQQASAQMGGALLGALGTGLNTGISLAQRG